jgi:hypothetical protein
MPQADPYIFIPGLNEKIAEAANLSDGSKVKFKQLPEGAFIYTKDLTPNGIDSIIELSMK